MQTLLKVMEKVPDGADFLADTVTVVVGIIAIWGFLFKRRELSLALRVFMNAYLQQRVSRLKETLGRLESLSYDNKNDRSEIQALMGQVCGQVKPLIPSCPQLEAVHSMLLETVEGNKRLTESKKRRIIYEIHGHLDTAAIAETTNVIRTDK